MSETKSTVDLEYLSEWVGREQHRSDDIHPWKASALSAAFDLDKVFFEGDTLPAAYQWMYFVDTPKASDVGADGHPKTGGFLPPAPFPRRMWAAGSMNLLHPLVCGQTAEKISTIRSVDFKSGRSGELFFVTVEHKTLQKGKTCLEEVQNLVYRAMPPVLAAGEEPKPMPAGVEAPIDADWREPAQADPVLLFRYSAMTSNNHRIHYDRDYAKTAEHYPALVVHGPLQATLLANFLSENLPDHSLVSFDFRAQRPIFDVDTFTLCGKQDGEKVSLWTESHDGYIGMWVDAVVQPNKSSPEEKV